MNSLQLPSCSTACTSNPGVAAIELLAASSVLCFFPALGLILGFDLVGSELLVFLFFKVVSLVVRGTVGLSGAQALLLTTLALFFGGGAVSVGVAGVGGASWDEECCSF